MPIPRKVLPAVQFARVTTLQAPAGVQQAPTGCGQFAVAQAVPAPWNVPGQIAETTRVQAPSLRQHAPVAVDGQGLGEHGSSGSHWVKPVHPESNVTEHAPEVRLQHAPVGGWKQGFGVHTAPLVQMLGLVQADWMVSVHPPMFEQQEPDGGAGQGLGEQDPPEVQTLFDPVHCTWTVVVQLPLSVLQQVPVTGAAQVLGVHVPPRVQTLVEAGQPTWAVVVQDPLMRLQHEPWGG